MCYYFAGISVILFGRGGFGGVSSRTRLLGRSRRSLLSLGVGQVDALRQILLAPRRSGLSCISLNITRMSG